MGLDLLKLFWISLTHKEIHKNTFLVRRVFLDKDAKGVEKQRLMFFLKFKKMYFGENTYKSLLQASFLHKNEACARLLLDDADFEYDGFGVSYVGKGNSLQVINGFFCNGLYNKSHPTWLLLLALKNFDDLIGFGRSDSYYFDFAKKVLSHQKINSFLKADSVVGIVKDFQEKEIMSFLNSFILESSLSEKVGRKVIKI